MKSNTSRVLIFIALLLFAASALVLGGWFIAPYLEGNSSPTPEESISATSAPAPASTWTLTPTVAASPTWTPLPTLTPTPTLTSSPTGTPTLTSLPPSLTPASQQDKETYQLHPWSPGHANNLAYRMEAYPDTLSGISQKEYFEAYYFAYLAQAEGILRYPDFAAQKLWNWDKAYNLAHLGHPLAAIEYAALISQAIQEGLTTPDSLANWIKAQDPRLTLKTYFPQEFADANQVLRLESAGGSATLWLHETENGIKVSALSNNFDFTSPPRISYLWSDFTQDGKPELIILNTNKPPEQIPLPRVFDLSGLHPQELSFAPDHELTMGLGYSSRWETVSPGERPVLEVSSSVYPPCPTTITHRYQWNGEWIEEFQTTYEVNPAPNLEYYCEQILEHALQAWGPEAGIALMEKLLPEWPPTTTAEGQSYPPDELDEWRFRLGIYHAQAGNLTKSAEYFTQIINHPSSFNNSWVKLALEFKNVLDDPQEFYYLCSQTPYCDPRQALQSWVSASPAWSITQLFSDFYASQLILADSGTYDFNNDSVNEGWMLLQHSFTSKPEFWIFAFSQGKPQALFIDVMENAEPVLTHYVKKSGASLVWLNRQKSFSLETLPWGEFYIKSYAPSYFYADYTSQVAHDSYLALFEGFSPAQIRDNLLAMQKSYSFVCLNDFECANFSYALGLAYELSGDKEKARDTYYEIWKKYPYSAFATMARLKIDAGDITTPTPTPTNTPTPTPTATSTPTVTPTPTNTLTPTTDAYP